MKKQLQKAKKEQERLSELYGDTCDDRFAYIAGYTSGGVPYGSTWEDMGIDPSLPLADKVALLVSECCAYRVTDPFL